MQEVRVMQCRCDSLHIRTVADSPAFTTVLVIIGRCKMATRICSHLTMWGIASLPGEGKGMR